MILFKLLNRAGISKIILFSLLLLFGDLAVAQVNTENLRAGTQRDGFRLTTNFNFGLSEGNVRFLNMLGNVRLDHQRKNNRAFGVVQYSLGVQEGDLYRNSGFIALRNTYYVKPAIGWEVFVQQQFDEFLRLQDRKLAGSGLRLRLINYQNDDQDNKLQLILGAGGMYEYEKIDSEILIEHSLVRSTNYVSLEWTLSERVSINTVTYFQFAVSDISNFRNLLDSTVEVKLAESVAMTVGVNHRYDSKPPTGVEPYDIEIRNGLRLLF